MCKRRLFRRLIRALFVSLFAALVLCEVGLRLIVRPGGPLPAFAPDASIDARRMSGTMPQYAHSPYWSPEFVKALSSIGQYAYMNDDGQWATHDFAVPGYTMRSGVRVTTDQPQRYTRTAWVYGSSTVWGAYVADGWTIPSYLQREFNRKGLSWRVVNMGQEGAALRMAYYWLGKTDVRSGDVVIFLDGANELGAALNAAVGEWRTTILPCRVSLPLLLLQAWCASATSGRVPQAFVDSAAPGEFAKDWQILAASRAYTLGKGAAWLHVVQPTPLANDWPALYRLYANGDVMLWADPRDSFDMWHYDDAGNAAMARQIAALFGPF